MYQQVNSFEARANHLQADRGLQNEITELFNRCGFVSKFLRTKQITSSLKFIKDDIWGNITLPPEIASIVETPLFQRLRNITNLGLTSFVYPSANHSLAEHTLGTYHILQKILNLTDPRLKPNFELEDTFYQHAALLTDFAQVPFGNFCSSILLNPDLQIFKALNLGGTPVSELIDTAIEILGFAKPSWMSSENFHLKILTSVFILSDSFRAFYDALWCFNNKNYKLKIEPSVALAACIFGFSFNGSKYFLHDIYYGPFGAHTIDELIRDTKRCLIPIPLDYERMLSTATIKVENDSSRRLFIDKLDPFVFNEINISKRLLNDRVYEHQWRIAFKNLFQLMLTNAVEKGERVPFMSGGKMDYLKIWSMSQGELLSACRFSGSYSSSLVADRLCYRQAPSRCFAIMDQTLIQNHTTHLANQNDTSLKQFFNDIDKLMFDKIKSKFVNEEFRNNFMSIVKEETLQICKKVNHDVQNTQDVELYCILNSSTQEQFIYPRVWTYDSLTKNDIRKDVIDKKQIESKIESIIFYSSHDIREIAFIAIKKLLFKHFSLTEEDLNHFFEGYKNRDVNIVQYKLSNMRFLIRPSIDIESCSVFCGLEPDQIIYYEKKLAIGKYFDDFPSIYPLTRDQLRRAKSLVDRFTSFKGDGGYTVNHLSMVNFVQQFPPKTRDGIFKFCEKIRILDRKVLISNLDKVITEIRQNEFQNIYICPLSDSSGSFMRNSIAKSYQNAVSCKDIRELLDKIDVANDIALIYDDNLISGTQATAVFSNWLGLQSNAKEINVDQNRLSRVHENKLRKANLHFSFYATWEEGISYLVQFLNDNGFQCSISNIHSKENIEEISGQRLSNKDLREFLRRVGTSLYLDKVKADGNFRAKPGIEKDRALGFDNLEGLMITDYSVPTSTYTAFWCPGVISYGPDSPDVAWHPLFVRNNSFKNFVW